LTPIPAPPIAAGDADRELTRVGGRSLTRGSHQERGQKWLFRDKCDDLNTGEVAVTGVIGLLTLALIGAMYRPLLFASVDEEVAQARRVPVQALAIGFMATLALAIAVAVQVVGVLLIFALLVAPAAIAERFTRRPSRAILASVLIALACTWLGLVLAYYFPYPVSFFIASLSFFGYVVARLAPFLLGKVHSGGQAPERSLQASASVP
jgi:ABC 3 transport family